MQNQMSQYNLLQSMRIEDTIKNYEPIPIGSKVKINIEEIKKSNLERSMSFLDFIESNIDTIFTVKSTTPHIAFLEESIFSFWEDHLIVLDSIEK